MAIDQGLAALLGAVVGGGLTFCATLLIEVMRERRQAESATVVAACETRALFKLLENRKWRDAIEMRLNWARTGQVDRMVVQVEKQFSLSRGTIVQIAARHPGVAERLTELIGISDGLVSDYQSLATHELDDPRSLLKRDDPDAAVEFYTEMLMLYDRAKTLRDEISNVVGRNYYRPWWKFWQKLDR